jgi:superoxide dismutase, Fe-Mn family
MTIHHTKHHNAYITNLNASLDKLDSAMSAGDITAIVVLQNAIKFNGGGHLNHTLFWENLSPEKNLPGVTLEAAIRESFGDYLNMKEKLTAKTVAVQGSGWGWLAYDKVTGMSNSFFKQLFYVVSFLKFCLSRLPKRRWS